MIRIIDYKAGNAPSVLHAVSHLGYEAAFARGPEDLENASHIILPGVGSARATMDSLCEMGIVKQLEQAVLQNRTPFLGICVGLQILFQHSEEEDTACLGWIPGNVQKFDANSVRVPQMGWNLVKLHESPINARLEKHFYFVNSYRAIPTDPEDIWGAADYEGRFAAAVRHENIYATQFHIEKSGPAGLALLDGFLKNAKEADKC